MNLARFKRQLAEAGENGYSWGLHLFRFGLLPIDGPLLRAPNTPRQEKLHAAFERQLFTAYMDAAQTAGQVRKKKGKKASSQ